MQFSSLKEVTELGFTGLSFCLVPREDPLQPVPGTLRGLSGRRLRWQVAAERDGQNARKKMIFVLHETSSIANTSLVVTLCSWESLFLQ